MVLVHDATTPGYWGGSIYTYRKSSGDIPNSMQCYCSARTTPQPSQDLVEPS